MASNTEFLDLLMKDPVADQNDTFNIETMLNENWRKIDANSKEIDETVSDLKKRYAIEKIAEVDITELTRSFYIELPETLSNYPLLIFKAINIHSGTNTGSTTNLYAVESTESTETLYAITSFYIGYANSGVNTFATIYPVLNSDGNVVISSAISGADTKYLYTAFVNKFNVGCHFEIWGAAK